MSHSSSSCRALPRNEPPSSGSPGSANPSAHQEQRLSRTMQPTGGDMQGMVPSMVPCLNGSAPQVTLHELQNGQPQQQQRQQTQNSALQGYDHSAAAAHDDFFDQVLSSLPWVDLNPANSKSPWDLAAANGGGEVASNGQKLFSVSLAGKPGLEEQPAGAEGLHYAAPYDESALLASRLRQHQISGGGGPPGPGKPMVAIQLNHASQQQHMLVTGMGRSAAAGDSGLLPLPLSLGSGDSGDPRLLVDRSRGDVDPSFKSLSSALGDGLYNRFGGSLQRAAPAATANQQNFHHPQAGAVPSQNLGCAGQAPAAGSAAGGAAPPRQRVRARRGQATDPHSIAERLRRERIAERMKALQELVPNANKTDKASMLDEIIDYVKFLQLQVKVLSMSRLGGAAAVVPLVADISSESSAGRSNAASQAAGSGDGLTVTEHQVAKLMEEDIGSAMQYLQGKGLCLMPISLASAISATTGHPRAAAHPNGSGNNNQNGSLLVPHAPASNADAPSSPSMSVLTVQSAMANGADTSAKDAASVSKP